MGVSQSPFCMIGHSGANSLPYYNIEGIVSFKQQYAEWYFSNCFSIVGNLDSGVSLKQVIMVEKKYMGENFFSALLMMGGMGLAVHFEQLHSCLECCSLWRSVSPCQESRPRWTWRCRYWTNRKDGR